MRRRTITHGIRDTRLAGSHYHVFDNRRLATSRSSAQLRIRSVIRSEQNSTDTNAPALYLLK